MSQRLADLSLATLKACGCMGAAISGDALTEIPRWISQQRKAGRDILTMTTEEVRTLKWGCEKCKRGK